MGKEPGGRHRREAELTSVVSLLRRASLGLLASYFAVSSEAQIPGISNDLLKAAEKGSPVAAYAVGAALEDRGDIAGAIGWYQKASAADYAGAQFRLGEITEKGTAGEPDPSEALKWYHKAAAQGFEPAVAALARLEGMSVGRPAGSPEAQPTSEAEAKPIEALSSAPPVPADSTTPNPPPRAPAVRVATPSETKLPEPFNNGWVVVILPYVLLSMWAGEKLVEPAVARWHNSQVAPSDKDRSAAGILGLLDAARARLLTTCIGTVIGLLGGVLYYLAVARPRERVRVGPESDD